ncbi:hypothetical protein MRB53_040893 [Persea americana]|nr:hypothetical protein MRB53_040893 [Persea americana]
MSVLSLALLSLTLVRASVENDPDHPSWLIVKDERMIKVCTGPDADPNQVIIGTSTAKVCQDIYNDWEMLDDLHGQTELSGTSVAARKGSSSDFTTKCVTLGHPCARLREGKQNPWKVDCPKDMEPDYKQSGSLTTGDCVPKRETSGSLVQCQDVDTRQKGSSGFFGCLGCSGS